MRYTTATILALMMITAFSASADLVYRETFALDTTLTTGEENDKDGAEFPFNGWGAHFGSGAEKLLSFGTANGRNNPDTGSPDPDGTGLTNIGANNPVNDGNGNSNLGLGRAFYTSNNTSDDRNEALLWTEEIANLGTTYSASDLNDISFYVRNSQSGDAIRLALKVGGAWHASNTAFTDSDNTWDQETLDFSSGEQWTSFDFEAGPDGTLTQNLDTSGTIDLDNDAGTVDALGFYVKVADVANAGFGLARFDHVEVDAVPEPATTAWMMGFATLAFALFRRKSNS